MFTELTQEEMMKIEGGNNSQSVGKITALKDILISIIDKIFK